MPTGSMIDAMPGGGYVSPGVVNEGFNYNPDSGTDKDEDKDTVQQVPGPPGFVGSMVFPIPGWSGSVPQSGTGLGFGDDRDGGARRHNGVDLFAPKGTPLVAVVSGVVIKAGNDGGKGGNRVWIRGADGTTYYYAHMNSISVGVGQSVQMGQQIGTVGNTGNAAGGDPHLHFEIHPGGGSATDPYPWLTGSSNPGAPTAGGAAAIDYTGSNDAINYGYFIPMLGRPATPQELNMINSGQWSTDHIINYIKGLPEFRNSPGYMAAAADYRERWRQIIGGEPPQSEIDQAIAKNWTMTQWEQRIRSLPEYRYGTEFKTAALSWNDLYEQMIGRPLTAEARAKRDEMLLSGRSTTEWIDWVKKSPEYDTGVEMNNMRYGVTGILDEMWGVGAVDDALALDPRFVDNRVWAELGYGASSAAIAAWARRQPEWMAGPQAATLRGQLRNTYGSIMRVNPSETYLDDLVRRGVTADMLYEDLRNTPQYQAMYRYKPAWMDEVSFMQWRDAYNVVGRQYFAPGQEYDISWVHRPGADDLTDPEALQALLDAGWKQENGKWYEPVYPDVWRYSDQQIGFFLESGISPTELAQHYAWTEDAIANLDTMNFLGKALGKTYTLDDAYIVASGAQGSGAIRAELIKAEYLHSFDTVFALYNGRKPTAKDYAYLDANFVSPQEYSARMAAVEYADKMFDDVDSLLMRVFGEHADKKKLQDVALGAKGSGAYEARIQLAEELDRYRWIHKQYWKTEPTPQDYAKYAGYAGPEELLKELTVREMVKSEGPEMMKTWNNYWVTQGQAPLTETDVETLVGKYVGWGELDAKLKLAEEHRNRAEQSRLYGLQTGPAAIYTSLTEFGGPMLPGLVRIGG